MRRLHRRCGHEHLRCDHSVEGRARTRCADCGRVVPFPLPTICSGTGHPHDPCLVQSDDKMHMCNAGLVGHPGPHACCTCDEEWED